MEWCFISSFNHQFLSEFKAYQESNIDDFTLPPETMVPMMYLHYPENETEDEQTTREQGIGANICVNKANQNVLGQFHKNRQMVGVWFSASPDQPQLNETEQNWEKLLNISETDSVDLIYTDFPLEVRKLYEQYE